MAASTHSPVTPLTDAEKNSLLDFSRPGGKTGRMAWNALVAEIKSARDGKYPPDWHPMVIRGKLFDEQNLPSPRCDDLSDVDPDETAFIEKLRSEGFKIIDLGSDGPVPFYAR